MSDESYPRDSAITRKREAYLSSIWEKVLAVEEVQIAIGDLILAIDEGLRQLRSVGLPDHPDGVESQAVGTIVERAARQLDESIRRNSPEIEEFYGTHLFGWIGHLIAYSASKALGVATRPVLEMADSCWGRPATRYLLPGNPVTMGSDGCGIVPPTVAETDLLDMRSYFDSLRPEGKRGRPLGSGRPRTDPALAERALSLYEAGKTQQEIAFDLYPREAYEPRMRQRVRRLLHRGRLNRAANRS